MHVGFWQVKLKERDKLKDNRHRGGVDNIKMNLKGIGS
jgi:hypothetical protein